MIYLPEPVEGRITAKLNRFLCEARIDGRAVRAHIPNSGRLTEFFTKGRPALFSREPSPARRTEYSLRAVRYAGRWVCVDSTVPNRLAAELARGQAPPLFKGYDTVKREHTLDHHRFDLALSGAGLPPLMVEVKSVTLVTDGVARFPDAPTARGRSHLDTLARLCGEGWRCAALFVIMRSDARVFEPNRATDPEFCAALRRARAAGVQLYALRCRVGRRAIAPLGFVEVDLG
ncbi:MAG: DNA/RNA nuclease SfsA [Nitrospinae bacterium]|nr:DNA/RNA nuclease SfsA [Nitrospinota bacterium]